MSYITSIFKKKKATNYIRSITTSIQNKFTTNTEEQNPIKNIKSSSKLSTQTENCNRSISVQRKSKQTHQAKAHVINTEIKSNFQSKMRDLTRINTRTKPALTWICSVRNLP